ncbi:MAG TPA: hypothetical protein VLA34_06610 [Candidatus Krumholzibacterium sp.]|nr:hypothetical protein [Candidatus Krumholzibacterium sp.]
MPLWALPLLTNSTGPDVTISAEDTSATEWANTPLPTIDVPKQNRAARRKQKTKKRSGYTRRGRGKK